MDLGQLDTTYLLQLMSGNIELDATISSMMAFPTIKQEYWTNWPVRPTEDDFQGLKGDIHFADAVDQVVSIQRGLRLKDAWVRMMNLVIKEKGEAVLEEWLSEVPFAVDNILGAWINGAKENKVYWLLKHKILCFIIHKIPVSELCFHREDPKNPNFITLTDAQYLVPE